MQLHETQHLVRSIFRGLPHLLLGGVPPERAGERRLAVRRLGVEPRGDLQLTCDAFANGEPIPIRYTADGGSAEPPLRFRGAPREARSLALLVEDPDAPTPRPFDVAKEMVRNVVSPRSGETLIGALPLSFPLTPP